MSGRRGPSDFYVAALDVLQSDGFPALTAAGLCDRMGVTRGSFYHHFESFDAFVDRLLEYWEQRYTKDPFALVHALEDEDEQKRERVLLAQQLPHGAEAAIRVWSTVNPQVARAQRRVDRQRREVTAGELVAMGLPDDDATLLADLAVSSLVGMQLLDQPVDPERLGRVVREIQRLIEATRAAHASPTT